MTSPAATEAQYPPPADGRGPIDRWFRISARGSTVGREVRGGLATFFAMAYIVVLNPIILGGGVDSSGHHLGAAALTTATAVVAGVMSVIMGVGGNLPLAIAAGLGLNSVVAYQIAPTMSWPDAMGLVVIEGIAICVLVATGLREMIMNAIPLALKKAIGVGIGLYIAFIGLVESGFVTTPKGAATPVQLGANGMLSGWPALVFCLGILFTLVLMVRNVRGAILISIITMTVIAVIVNAAVHVPAAQWGLIVPKLPHHLVATPDFGLIGHFSLFGGFGKAGVITAVVFVFTLVLSDFFDAMGTIVGITGEAGLLDERGRVPGIGRVLFIDGLAAVAGGAGSCSSNTCFVESAAGVGEGARTGMANVVTGVLLFLMAFLTPLAAVVPEQAATPALVVVGFLLMTQVRDIPWNDWTLAAPAFLTIALMPMTYSITDGIGAGFLAFVVIRIATSRAREVHWLLWIVAVFFLAYFALDPIKHWLGVH